jgi:hypothetical protein
MRQTADASSLGNPLARIPSRLIPLITAENMELDGLCPIPVLIVPSIANWSSDANAHRGMPSVSAAWEASRRASRVGWTTNLIGRWQSSNGRDAQRLLPSRRSLRTRRPL